MPRNNEICNGVKYSTSSTRPPRRNEGKLLSKINSLQGQLESYKNALEIEKNAKNKAYYYIISSGNFNRFADFCKKHPATLDYHGACVAELFIKAITNEE